jgi:predicted GNAT family N-acyltransferase
MSHPLDILILTAIEDSDTRERFRTLLDSSLPATPDRSITVDSCSALREEVVTRLKSHFRATNSRAAILVSDGFHVEAMPEDHATPAARDLAAEFADYAYATIAIVERPDKLEDIDRTVARNCTLAEFRAALHLCFVKLAYLSPPNPRKLSCRVDIRTIENQADLYKCFEMRKKIYTPMAYLNPAVEQLRSRMEIDWFDTRSTHVGAFAECNGYEELVGVARLITTEPLRRDHAAWTLELAATDPALNSLVTQGAVLALLPVIQSHRTLEEYLQQAFREDFLIGELSRVIVDLNYRGAGISHRLVTHALKVAADAEVRHLFLECLPIHECLYAKSGFQKLPGVEGTVYMVDRTMIVMHRALVPVSQPARALRA